MRFPSRAPRQSRSPKRVSVKDVPWSDEMAGIRLNATGIVASHCSDVAEHADEALDVLGRPAVDDVEISRRRRHALKNPGSHAYDDGLHVCVS